MELNREHKLTEGDRPLAGDENDPTKGPDWQGAIADASATVAERVQAQEDAAPPPVSRPTGIIAAVVALVVFSVLAVRAYREFTFVPPDLPAAELRSDLITALIWTVEDIEDVAADSGRVLTPAEVSALELLPEGWTYRRDDPGYAVEARQDELVLRFTTRQGLANWEDSIRGGGL